MYQLDEREAFEAMIQFIERFMEEAGNDLLTLYADIQLQADGMPWDPAAWGDWLDSVQAVKEGRSPHPGPG